jgi:hypothetical protein
VAKVNYRRWLRLDARPAVFFYESDRQPRGFYPCDALASVCIGRGDVFG